MQGLQGTVGEKGEAGEPGEKVTKKTVWLNESIIKSPILFTELTWWKFDGMNSTCHNE